MPNKNSLQSTLQKELKQLKELADEQMYAYKSSRTLLYKGLARVYLWWVKANKEKGLLEKLYKQNNIQYKKEIKTSENYSPLLQYLWGMDGTVNSNTIDLWNRTLNKVHTTVISDTYYKTNTENKIISFISDKGGIRGLAGYDSLATVDVAKAPPKTFKLSVDVKKKRHVEHLEKSKMYFAQTAKPISKFETKHSLPTADSSIGLGLFRKTKNGYELLKAVDDKNLIEQALVGAYARSTDSVPYTVSLLTEIIATQTVPKALESLSRSLADKSKAKTDDGKVMDSLKRLLYRSKEGVFLLSANRSACSVVTVATPKQKVMSSKQNVAMRVQDGTWIEDNVIHSGDINFFTTNSPKTLQPITSKNEKATHKLLLENTLTKQERNVRFYPLNIYKNEASRTQAVQSVAIKAVHKTKLDANWLAELNGEFLSRWVNGLGKRMKRQEHSVFALSFGKKGIEFKWEQRADDYADKQLITYTYPNKTKAITVEVLAKDIIPILNALVYGDLKGSVAVDVDSKAIQFKYETLNATYQIAVPTANSKGKRNGDYFKASEG